MSGKPHPRHKQGPAAQTDQGSLHMPNKLLTSSKCHILMDMQTDV